MCNTLHMILLTRNCPTQTLCTLSRLSYNIVTYSLLCMLGTSVRESLQVTIKKVVSMTSCPPDDGSCDSLKVEVQCVVKTCWAAYSQDTTK